MLCLEKKQTNKKLMGSTMKRRLGAEFQTLGNPQLKLRKGKMTASSCRHINVLISCTSPTQLTHWDREKAFLLHFYT